MITHYEVKFFGVPHLIPHDSRLSFRIQEVLGGDDELQIFPDLMNLRISSALKVERFRLKHLNGTIWTSPNFIMSYPNPLGQLALLQTEDLDPEMIIGEIRQNLSKKLPYQLREMDTPQAADLPSVEDRDRELRVETFFQDTDLHSRHTDIAVAHHKMLKHLQSMLGRVIVAQTGKLDVLQLSADITPLQELITEYQQAQG